MIIMHDQDEAARSAGEGAKEEERERVGVRVMFFVVARGHKGVLCVRQRYGRRR